MQERHRLKNRLLTLLFKKSSEEGRRIHQTELASAIGVANNTISNWVAGDMTKIDISVMIRLCEYFNCDLCDLLYLEPLEGEGEGQP